MINVERLMQDIDALAKIGRQEGGGIARRSFDEADIKARAWLSETIRSAHLDLKVDAAGNLFGRIDGDGPAVISGSHLDTIVNGGPLDGALGVVCALECLRVIKERNLPLKLPVEMVAFTDEEERFMFGLGSSAFAGRLDASHAEQLSDSDNIYLRDAMAAAGLNIEDIGKAHRDPKDIKAFVELHIEQGPLLENGGISIGVVDTVLGNYRFGVQLDGQRDHAGNPMRFRHDPLLAAVSVINSQRKYSKAISREEKDEMLFTTGAFQVDPGISNVIPEKVCFTIDYRHANRNLLDRVEENLHACVQALCDQIGIDGSINRMQRVAPILFSPMVCDAIIGAADSLGIAWQRISSGAGHDAQILGSDMPTAMIFVPSKGGRSHCPSEHTDKNDIRDGANVLLRTLLNLAQ